MTHSRVAVLTGLSRQEVVRLVQPAAEAEPVTKGPLNRATRVIGGWLQDSDFVTPERQPKTLAIRGEEHSFEALVARYSGGITARAILDELLRVGAVIKVGKDVVKLNTEGYVPSNDQTALIEMAVNHVGDMLDTLVHNLSHEPDQRRFQRQVAYTDIPSSIEKEFKIVSYEKSLTLLLELNQWLAEKKKSSPGLEEEKSRVGLGIYYFKNEVEKDKL